MRTVAAIVAATAGVATGLVPVALSVTTDDRRTTTIAMLIGSLAAAALFAALTVALAGTLAACDGDPPASLVISAAAAAVAAGWLGTLRLGGRTAAIAGLGAIAAVGVGYLARAAQDRDGVRRRLRLLDDMLGAASDRLAEPWLVLAAQEATAEYRAADVSAALVGGQEVVALAAVGLGALTAILTTLPAAVTPGRVALAITALVLVVRAGGALGTAARVVRTARTAAGAGTLDATPVVAPRRRPEARPRRHSGALSFRALEIGSTTFSLEVAPREHVGIEVPPGRWGRDIAAAVAASRGGEEPSVVHHGVDGRTLDRPDVLRHVAVVTPEGTLLPGSLGENLTPGGAGVDQGSLLGVARMWGLSRSLTDDLDARIDVHAWPPEAMLRLAAARAWLAEPSVVVIHDPYPPGSDGPMLSPQDVNALASGRTVVRVSSRPDALADCDFVIRLAP